MQILELHLKNFGKFTDYHIDFAEQIEVFYGENEYGKSTIHAFIKAMLFGMERGRGRAAGKDEFSRYEPWENPNYYAGMMRFCCGGRTFRLERTFDRYTKNSSLICEDDGEELSVEAGDLEMLLGGMTASSFENTAAIGQLTAKPGQGLAAELKNYAANYYETGSSDVNLQGALDCLKGRKKQIEQEQKEYQEKRRKNREELEVQKRYVEMDAERLREELEETKQELRELKHRVKVQSKGGVQQGEKQQIRNIEETQGISKGQDEERSLRCKEQRNVSAAKKVSKKSSRGHGSRKVSVAAGFGVLIGAVLAVGGAGTCGYGLLREMSSQMLTLAGICAVVGIGVLLLGIFLFVKKKKTVSAELSEDGYIRDNNEPEENDSMADSDSDTESRSREYEIQKLEWELLRIQEELKEKQLLRGNLQEQLLELEDSGEQERKLRKKLRALELAEIRMKEAAEDMVHSFGEQLNTETSRILCEITDGRYNRLMIDENMDMAVLHDGRKIPVERLSRGTIEQVYFSLRMAALGILYEEEIPVILDDAFVFYDEKRLKSALKWLSVQTRQVIIFSCQTREKQFLEG